MTKRRALIFVFLLGFLAVDARAVTAVRVTVATTATLLYTAPASAACPTSPACRVLVRNPSANSVYVGPVGVTTATGFEIAAGDAMSLSLASADKLYGIVAAATEVVYTIHGGVQ